MYRPLSPHIFIYKPQWSSIFSVFHRATGVILILSLFFLICFTTALSHHITHYSTYLLGCFLNTYGAWLLVAVLVISTFSLFYHIFNGIRHLIWDFAPHKFLHINKVEQSAYFILFLTLLCSLTCILTFL